MKKLVLIVLMGLVAGTTNANQWQEQPLAINNEMPQQMGEPVKAQPVRMEQNNYLNISGSNSDSYTTFNIGYAGSKIGSNDMGGDEKFNGVDLGISGVRGNLIGGFGYTYQGGDDLNYSEIYSKLGYKLFNQNNSYGVASIGVGYAWASADDYDIDLEYITMPIEMEIGYQVQPNLAFYGAVGYKWLWNTDVSVCYMGICGSDSGSDYDVDGVTYKAGLRYNF
jgi:hypothetical protein